jgi:hypothetical protein
MALATSPIHLPSTRADTPMVDTVTLIAIRARIEPNENWWQFAIRPWHVIVAAASYLAVVAAGIAAIAWAGAVR